jgi:hypothetical protein
MSADEFAQFFLNRERTQDDYDTEFIAIIQANYTGRQCKSLRLMAEAYESDAA